MTPAARPSPDAAAVWTTLFCRMLPPRNRSAAIEITAAGIDAETVSPANRPRYMLAPPRMIARTQPRITDAGVISGNVLSAGMYGVCGAAFASGFEGVSDKVRHCNPIRPRGYAT